MMRRLLLVAVSLLAHGDLHAEPSEAEKRGMPSTLIIYNAKGPPDSCGLGCDRWIAIEGQIDEDAAPRIRRFLAGIKDTKRPIYLHSPGGKVGPSYVIGRLLRNRKSVARVERTVAKACAAGSQADAACLKIKTAGGEVEAELTPRGAMCNSACGYLLIGAGRREISPYAMVGVHNSRYMMVVHGHPSARLIEQFRERGVERANRERANFIASMGIDRELDDLIKTVKFESIHVLTRAELYRFGIDTRLAIEEPWILQSSPPANLLKFAFVKKSDSVDFRKIWLRLACRRGDGASLTFLYEANKDVKPAGAVELVLNSQKRLSFLREGGTNRNYVFWNLIMDQDTLMGLLSSPRVQVEESLSQSKLDVSSAGLEDGWKKVAQSCGAGEPASTTQPLAAPGYLASPAARVTTTRPEPGSIWPDVTTAAPAATTTAPGQ